MNDKIISSWKIKVQKERLANKKPKRKLPIVVTKRPTIKR